MRTKFFHGDGDDYLRPQQTWQCGLGDEGPPCPAGPDGRGCCPAAAACRPIRDGDRWQCNRSPLRGGPGAAGPNPAGECGVVFRCTPVRSLRSRRGRIAWAAFLAAAGGACAILAVSTRNDWLAPGRLSQHHAQLLEAGEPTQRCGACHAAGNATLAQWRQHTSGTAAWATTQTELCMKCHGKDFPAALATTAHNRADWQKLPSHAAPSVSSPRRDPAEPIACAACHREHQGAGHDLTAMDDQACQACHQSRVTSFAVDHPEFSSWPYASANASATRIAFNHGSHLREHFPKEGRPFDCGRCHGSDPSGFQTTLDHATACAQCHDRAIVASLSEGTPFVSLPTLDVDALAKRGQALEDWPPQASGDFEGQLPAAMQLLLAANEPAAAALVRLGPKFDFFDLEVSDSEQLAAAATIAAASRDLVRDLAERGHAAIGARLAKVIGRALTTEQLSALVGGLSSDALRGCREQWFGEANGAATGVDRATANRLTTAGGWIRDDLTLSLRHQAVGHGDPWLRAWLDVLAEASQGQHQALAQPLLLAALKSDAPGRCGSCHTLQAGVDGKSLIRWKALLPGENRGNLTHFSHRPHLLQPQLQDCTACHQVAPASVKNVGRVEGVAAGSATASAGVADFAPLAKSACAVCHTPRGAGEGCAQCHRYHSSPPGGELASAIKALTTP